MVACCVMFANYAPLSPSQKNTYRSLADGTSLRRSHPSVLAGAAAAHCTRVCCDPLSALEAESAATLLNLRRRDDSGSAVACDQRTPAPDSAEMSSAVAAVLRQQRPPTEAV